jgi:hypothetical protein
MQFNQAYLVGVQLSPGVTVGLHSWKSQRITEKCRTEHFSRNTYLTF